MVNITKQFCHDTNKSFLTTKNKKIPSMESQISKKNETWTPLSMLKIKQNITI